MLSYGGSPDFSFGSYGFVPYGVPAATGHLNSDASALGPDGKLVVIGYTDSFGAMGDVLDFAASRFNADGSLDTTFGTGGYFTSPLLSFTTFSTRYVSANGIAFQSNGDIVLTGTVASVAKVVRLTPNGALDTTFGTGGIVTLGTAGLSTSDNKLDYGASVAILPNGQIAVGGSTENGFLYPAVTRLDANGTVDTTYGTAGTAIVPVVAGFAGYFGDGSDNTSGMVVQSDGAVDIVANSDQDTGPGGIIVSQFNVNGVLDSTYGTGGQQIISPTSTPSIPFSIGADSLAIQSDGKLIIGGGSQYGMAAVRLNTDGTPDTTFGIGGADILAHTTLTYADAYAIAIQADGKILLAQQNSSDVVVRLDADGLPDPSFGEGGTATFPVPDSQQYNGLVGVSVLSNGDIEAAELTQGLGYGLIRMIPNGSEGDYNEDGISDPAILLTTDAVFADDPSGGATGQLTQIGDAGAGETMPAPGAYDGGGISEIGVYLPSQGAFEIEPYTGGAPVVTSFGSPGIGNTYPAPGDYDGSGKTELAVYVPTLGDFLFRPSDGGRDVVVPFGTAGAGQSIPVPADYFGTGQTNFAVYLVAQGAYEIQNPITGQDYTIPFGTPGAGQSIPVPGDYDGSGHVELAVYLPASGDLIYRPANGGADVTVPFGLPGVAMTLPAPGDYDGSGDTEIGGYLPSEGDFEYLPASGSALVVIPFGVPNETVAFSMGTNAVSESGIGAPPPSANFVVASGSAEIPLTPDVLDTLDGTIQKKKSATG